MIKIAFVHEGKSYLPEVDAYVDYLNTHEQFEAKIVRSNEELDETYDIIWKFMGIDMKYPKDAVIIHEYNTITVGKYSHLKDLLKRILNCRPDGRVFQNEKVKSVYGFNDKVPYIFRDMGIDKSYYNVESVKEYDFVYVGTMDPSRDLGRMLKFFKAHPEFSIVLIGAPNEQLVSEFGELNNVTFAGRIPNKELPMLASKARYGLNYIPDVYPFNEQTSTKLLEYCALGLDIVTTDYQWINQFEQTNNGKFFKIDADLSNVTKDTIESFDFKTPGLEDMEWHRLFDNAQLIPFLLNIYNEKINKQIEK